MKLKSTIDGVYFADGEWDQKFKIGKAYEVPDDIAEKLVKYAFIEKVEE